MKAFMDNLLPYYRSCALEHFQIKWGQVKDQEIMKMLSLVSNLSADLADVAVLKVSAILQKYPKLFGYLTVKLKQNQSFYVFVGSALKSYQT